MNTGTGAKFLSSILMPEGSPQSIPDDNVRRHVVRQETVTANIIPIDDTHAGAGVDGILVFYPNTPSSLIGVHYMKSNATGQYNYQSTIFTAQELAGSYNYARKSSGIIYVRSATLPSGVYALTGTFNAVTYEGAPSEVGLPTYNAVLRVTSNPMDKVGNVLVGSGIAILTLPATYDLPYLRLQDPSPSTIGAARIRDSQQNLVYTWETPTNNVVVVNDTAVHSVGTVNFDCNTLLTLECNLSLEVVIPATTTTAFTYSINIIFNALDLAGAIIAPITTYQLDHFFPMGTPDSYVSYQGSITASLPVGSSFMPRPVAAIQLAYQQVTTLNAQASQALIQPSSVILTSHSAGSPGSMFPVSIVAYSGVASGTVVSVAGVANYELIPNPALAQNVETYYGKRDPHGMDYVKAVMASRDRLGIRSVWKLEDYKNARPFFEELLEPEIGRSKYHIEAFDWGNLLKVGAQLLPFISNAIVPGTGAPVAGITQGLTQLFSASGAPIAASGNPIGPVAENTGVLVNAASGQPRKTKKGNRIY
jgi:hypothetical protein